MIKRQEKEFEKMIVVQRPRMPLQPPYPAKEVIRRQEKEFQKIIVVQRPRMPL